jgi:AraC-like DNA-binding protein
MDPAWQPVVLFAARTHCPATWRWHNPEGHRDCANLWLIADGHGAWASGGREWPCDAGDLFVQRLWRECVGTHDPRRQLDVLWANIGWRDAAGSPVDLRRVEADLPAIHRRVADLAFCAALARRMIASFTANGANPEADRWLACLLAEADRDLGDDRDGVMAAVQEAVRRDPGRPWRVAGLARSAGLDVDVFTRRFRAATGMPPRRFLVQARLESAKALLRMSDLTVGAIAERLGFCDVYHFSRRFRDHVGCAPSAYRAGRDAAAG